MADMTKHTKAQLVELLEERQGENATLRQANAQMGESIATLEQAIANKDEAMERMEQRERTPLPITETAESIISNILTLPREEQEVLPQLIRTTPRGIDAYTCFVYGHANNHGDDSSDGGNDDTDGGSDDGRPKNQGER